MSIPSSDLLWEMACLISNGGKPCYHQDIHFLGKEKPTLSPAKDCLLRIKEKFPRVKFYIHRVVSEDFGQRVVSYMFLMYRFEFQKEIYKFRFTKRPVNSTLLSWSIAGLLFGYSPREIQERYDENNKKFGEIFS